MSFIRIKIVQNKQYKYLVKCERVADRVKQNVVMYIGPITPIYKIKKDRKSNAHLFAKAPTADERRALEHATASSSAFTRDRTRIILLSLDKLPCEEIAENVRYNRRKVEIAINAFNKCGIRCLERKKSTGAPLEFTREQRAEMLRIATTSPLTLGQSFTTWSLRKLRDYLIREKIFTKISHESIRRMLRAEGFRVKKGKRFQYSNDPDFVKKNCA